MGRRAKLDFALAPFYYTRVMSVLAKKNTYGTDERNEMYYMFRRGKRVGTSLYVKMYKSKIEHTRFYRPSLRM